MYIFLKFRLDEENYKLRLHQAIDREDVKVIHDLIRDGVDVNAKDETDGSTPLHVALNCNNKEIVKILLNAKVDVNVPDNEGLTGLQLALRNFDADMSKTFNDAGFDVANLRDDQSGEVALHYAVMNNDLELIEYLMSQGADIEAKNNLFSSPLQWACSPTFCDWNEEIVECLLLNGADVNASDIRGSTPLQRMVEKCSEVNVQALRFLLQCSDIDRLNSRNENILEIAHTVYARKCIIEHIAILMALDVQVSQCLRESLASGYEKKYFKKCKKELEKAKSTKFRDSWVTYFNLLVDSKLKLKNYAGNEDLMEEFYSNWVKLLFPAYGEEMQKNVERGIKIRQSFDKSSVILCHCLPVFNPTHLIVRDILDCLIKHELPLLEV